MTTTKILMIEDNPGDARLLREMLAEANTNADVRHVVRLEVGLQHLQRERFDVILLDLSLPDSQGLDTLARVLAEASETPVVVLTGHDDQETGIQAVQKGAQDYLVKDRVDGHLLNRAIRYAIERHRMQAMLRSLSLTDDLTQLHNRRGFFTLAEQQRKLAQRAGSPFLLVFIDLDGLKMINDTFGHRQGDQALVKAARLIKDVFRDSDVVARIGGDEFVILAVGASPADASVLIKRLRRKVAERNTSGNPGYRLSFSAGTAFYDPDAPCSIEELLSQADRRMYREKRRKKGNPPNQTYSVVAGETGD